MPTDFSARLEGIALTTVRRIFPPVPGPAERCQRGAIILAAAADLWNSDLENTSILVARQPRDAQGCVLAERGSSDW